MNETAKLVVFDVVTVLLVTLVAGAVLGMIAGFDFVNWFAIFIGAVIGRCITIWVTRRYV